MLNIDSTDFSFKNIQSLKKSVTSVTAEQSVFKQLSVVPKIQLVGK